MEVARARLAEELDAHDDRLAEELGADGDRLAEAVGRRRLTGRRAGPRPLAFKLLPPPPLRGWRTRSG